MSVTTRHDPRTRAGAGRDGVRQCGSRVGRRPRPPGRAHKVVLRRVRRWRVRRRRVRPDRRLPVRQPVHRPAGQCPVARPAARPAGSPPRPAPKRRHRPPAKPTRPAGISWAGGSFSRRVRLVRFLLLIAMLFLVARLVDVQVLHAGAYEAAARGESSITVSLPSLRGGIFAGTDGSPLAMSVATDDVVADDFQVAHPVETALALSPLIHVPTTTLAAELHRPSGYVVLARQVGGVHGPADRCRCDPRDHDHRRCQAGRPQREPCFSRNRVHQRRRAGARAGSTIRRQPEVGRRQRQGDDRRVTLGRGRSRSRP